MTSQITPHLPRAVLTAEQLELNQHEKGSLELSVVMDEMHIAVDELHNLVSASNSVLMDKTEQPQETRVVLTLLGAMQLHIDTLKRYCAQ